MNMIIELWRYNAPHHINGGRHHNWSAGLLALGIDWQ
jgi:hypothetical protein